jgi:hypothetical protein
MLAKRGPMVVVRFKWARMLEQEAAPWSQTAALVVVTNGPDRHREMARRSGRLFQF